MVDAQTWFKKNYENNKNTEAIVVKKGTELEGNLEINGYSNLKNIFLPSTKGITGLNIIGCPNVELISVWGNEIKEIKGLTELSELRTLNISENQLKEIDISSNSALEVLYFRKNPGLKFTGGFKTLKTLLKLVTWNSAGTFPIADLLKEEGLSEGDLKEIAGKLGVKIEEGKPKEDIKKEIIAEIDKKVQNEEKLKNPTTGIPDSLNEKGEINKDKLEKLKNDAKEYQALVKEGKNDPVKNEDKTKIDQAALTKVIDLLSKAGINPTDPDAEKKAEDLKKVKEAVEEAGLDPEKIGEQVTELKEKNTRLEIIAKEIYGEDYKKQWEMSIEIPTNK